MSDGRQWFRVRRSYQKPAGGFLAIGPRYPGVLSDDGVVLFTHPGDAQWTEILCMGFWGAMTSRRELGSN